MKVKHSLWIGDERIGLPTLAQQLEALSDAAPSAWVRLTQDMNTAQSEMGIDIISSLEDEAAVGEWFCSDGPGFVAGQYSERELAD